jgi:PhoPQ-activated pathogenicity-related protein
VKKLASFVVAVSLVLLLRAASVQSAQPQAGPLADYVKKPDDSFKWVKRQEGEFGGVKFVELILTSQTWKGITWKHQLYLARPEEFKNPQQGMLIIWGGDWHDELDQPADSANVKVPDAAPIIAQIVKQFKSPVALLLQVPFQPIFDGKTEDDAIAYTFDQYLSTQDPEWPLLFPMVKSAVRAMDATQQFGKAEWNIDIKNFTVAGASKRGWTTWLTGAVDPRANAIAPIVIDTLNMPAQMRNQLASWGEYSEQIQDYTRRGIQQKMDTPAGRKLVSWVDPYNYRDSLTQPKLLVMGTNDRYWCLDACNLYWNDLLGEKHLLYVPNKGHGVDDFARLIGSIGALHKQAAGQLALPNLSWDLKEEEGKVKLSVGCDVPPVKVVAWTTTAPTRDFRESKWSPRPTSKVDDKYVYEQPLPANGYAALFGEAVFKDGTMSYFLSTNVKIVQAPEGKSTTAGE